MMDWCRWFVSLWVCWFGFGFGEKVDGRRIWLRGCWIFIVSKKTNEKIVIKLYLEDIISN